MNAPLQTEFPKPYPFSALVGQPALQQALLLAAIDPGIGGVLVSGPRGTAKSTAARSLAELLTRGRFVTLPLGATEERLVGTLDLDEVLRGGAVRFSPGLLAEANEGVLYVDEVNLLSDALVDVLLDAAASGVNVVERDGISHRHAARFVLVGTMNPEEGELRPQLLDRFGLTVALENCFDAPLRQRIVKARLAFEADPDVFRAAYANEQQLLAERIEAARAELGRFSFDDDVHARVSACCIEAAVDGMRADLVMLRAARALAAFEGVDAVTTEHVDRVAAAVLLHRQRERNMPSESARSAPPSGGDRSTSRHDGAGAPRGETSESGRTDGDAAPRDDWGYLPPEAVGMVEVKQAVALDTKKR